MARTQRILFLDVDGVICCNFAGKIEADKLEQVRRICHTTNSQVVLSSDWRRQPDLMHRLQMTLASVGVRCVGATPQYPLFARVRPKEILAWLAASGQNVVQWCAVDDRDLLSEEGGMPAFDGHFVLTEFHSGLTAECANRCIDHLLAPTAATSLQQTAPTPLQRRPYAPVDRRGGFEEHSAPEAVTSTTAAAQPPKQAMVIDNMLALLDDASLTHLDSILDGKVTLLEACDILEQPEGGGRVALLTRLRGCGVSKIFERQALVNALGRAIRQGRVKNCEPPSGVPATARAHNGPGAERRVARNTHDAFDDVDGVVPGGERPLDQPKQQMHPGLRGFAYLSGGRISGTPALAANDRAPLPPRASFVSVGGAPKDEKAVALCLPGSKVTIGTGLLALQPHAHLACVVAHPHPSHGGDMYNAFVSAAVQSFCLAGISTLRFNFSPPDGVQAEGAGDLEAQEAEELMRVNTRELSAAVHTLQLSAPSASIVVVGYSWGGLVALSAARSSLSTGIEAVALVAPPLATAPRSLHPTRRDFARWPMLLAAGDTDEFCPANQLRETAGANATTVIVMPGAGHFFNGTRAESAARQVVSWTEGLQLQH